VKRILLGVVVVAVVLALAAFEPWRLFTSSEIDEAAPTSAVDAAAESPSAAPTPQRGRTPATPTPRDERLASGAFEDAEHGTTGTAVVLRLADGRRFVRLEGLATSDGPDLHVWLSDAPSGGDWGSYDDGRYVRLGELKATHGNQNYEIPAGADLGGMRSVVVWCDRFDVAFGTAPVAL
jgi:hypothetical protein